MVRITKDVLRRKSEHNEGTMAELEEISLHQMEIERIENIDALCPKLRILYLQNNIIGKLENLRRLKDLEYLNVALNNITKIEGLQSCEFLNKLDLTVNFIDVDAWEESVSNLERNSHLCDIYIVGNPVCEWEGHFDYLVARLPQVRRVDGKEITRTQRILAAQRLPSLSAELRELARAKLKEKATQAPAADVLLGEDELCDHTPEVRTEIYREMAEQKAEKEAEEKSRRPRERDYANEHKTAAASATTKESCFFPDGRVKQTNQGGFKFSFEENRRFLTLRVQIPRFVDTSLVEADVQPTYVTIVIKNKVLRLELPGEVKPDSGKCERSQTTGELKLTLPKVRQGEVVALAYGKTDECERAEIGEAKPKPNRKLAEKMLDVGMPQGAVDLKSIYKGKENPNLKKERPEIYDAASKLESASLDDESCNRSAKDAERQERISNVPPLE